MTQTQDPGSQDVPSSALQEGDMKEAVENAPQSQTSESADTINPGVDKGSDSSQDA
jgi:hypothetical protein